MDEKQVRKINRQLRGIKVMLGFFSFLLIAMLVIMAFIAWKVVTFTNHVNTKITTIEQTTKQQLDIKSQLCDSPTTSIARQLCE